MVLWLTLLAIGFAALRILIVSRGDSETLRALVQNLNVTAIVLATILPWLAVVIVLVSILTFFTGLANYKFKEDLDEKQRYFNLMLFSVIVLGPLTAAICWFGMPLRYMVIAASLSGVAISTILVTWYFKRVRRLVESIAILLLVLVLAAGIWIVIGQNAVWLPKEQLKIGWFSTGPVYVLSSDEVWTKYLHYESNRVYIVPTDTVTGRLPVIEGNDSWSRTPSEWWSDTG